MKRKSPDNGVYARALKRAYDLDTEQGLLGGVFLNPSLLAQLDTLEVEDFYSPEHQAVWSAMLGLDAEGIAIDQITVAAEIKRKRILMASNQQQREFAESQEIDVVAMCADLTLRAPSADNVLEYAKIVKRHRTTRDAVITMSQVVSTIADQDGDGDSAIGMAIDRLQRIEVGATGLNDRGHTMGHHVEAEFKQFMADLSAKEAGRKFLPGMPTGIEAIDKRTGGVPFTVLSVVGARPAHGKTTFAMKLIESAMTIADDDPLIFTFEDSGKSFAARRLAQASGVPTRKIITRDVDLDELRRLEAAYQKLRTSPDTLVLAAGMQVEDVGRYVKAHRRRRSGKLGLSRTRGRLIVVDYFQKMPMNPEYRWKRNEAIGHITRTLSWLAQEESAEAGNEVAIVGLSQLGREVDKRDNPTPMLADFKDSGDIEQDAKMAIGLIYWHEYDKKKDPTVLEAHILKNHNGEAGGYVPVHWDRPTHTLSDSLDDLPTTRRRASWGSPGGKRFDGAPHPSEVDR